MHSDIFAVWGTECESRRLDKINTTYMQSLLYLKNGFLWRHCGYWKKTVQQPKLVTHQLACGPCQRSWHDIWQKKKSRNAHCLWVVHIQYRFLLLPHPKKMFFFVVFFSISHYPETISSASLAQNDQRIQGLKLQTDYRCLQSVHVSGFSSFKSWYIYSIPYFSRLPGHCKTCGRFVFFVFLREKILFTLWLEIKQKASQPNEPGVKRSDSHLKIITDSRWATLNHTQVHAAWQSAQTVGCSAAISETRAKGFSPGLMKISRSV